MLFSGCGNAEKELEEKSMFIIVEHLNIDGTCIIYVLVNKETKVMYITQYEGGMTVMLNPDGTPMLWEGELEGENK
jgi:hypothetical protein